MGGATVSFTPGQLLHHNVVYHNVLRWNILGLCNLAIVQLHVLLISPSLLLRSLNLLIQNGLILRGITMVVLMALTGKIGLRGDSVEGRKSLALGVVDVHVLELWFEHAGQLFKLLLRDILLGRHFIEHRLLFLMFLETDIYAVFNNIGVVFAFRDFGCLFDVCSDLCNFLVDISLFRVV